MQVLENPSLQGQQRLCRPQIVTGKISETGSNRIHRERRKRSHNDVLSGNIKSICSVRKDVEIMHSRIAAFQGLKNIKEKTNPHVRF